MFITIAHNRASAVFAAVMMAFLCGCHTAPKAPSKYTFFPPAPSEPRVQFLTAFSSDTDFGRKTSFVEYLTGRPNLPAKVVKPYGLAVKPGEIRVCDSAIGVLEVFDLVQKQGRCFTPHGEGHLQTPINISIDSDGTQYVADTGRNQVLLFSKDDTYLGAMGGKDEMKPTDVAITPDRLYVTDLSHCAVRVYNKADRTLLFTIPRDKADPKAKLYQPTNLALDGKGQLWISDTGGFSVQVYDLEGNHLRSVGRQGVAPGFFARPKGIAANREGEVFVVDAATQVVQVFDPEGRLLMYFGQPGASDAGQLCLPASVKVDYENVKYFESLVAPGYQLEHLILVTSQFGGNKVNIYGFVHRQQDRK